MRERLLVANSPTLARSLGRRSPKTIPAAGRVRPILDQTLGQHGRDMASLLSSRRANPAISLQATVRQTRRRGPSQRDPDQALLGWFPLGVAGGVLSSLTGWVLITGTVVLGWLAAEPGTLAQSLDIGTRVWLLTNGVETRLGSASVSIVPWGATAVFAFLVCRSAAFAARRAKRRSTARLAAISGATAAGYLAPVVVVALASGDGWSSVSRFGFVFLVVWLSAAVGVSRARNEDLTARWPRWASVLSRGVVSAQLVMLIAGSAAVASGLIRH